MKQKDIKELWELCGFEGRFINRYEVGGGSGVYRGFEYPDGRHRLRLPPLTLDNLFQYAVPKISFGEMRFLLLEEGAWMCSLDYVGKNDSTYSATEKTPAEALGHVCLEVLRK